MFDSMSRMIRYVKTFCYQLVFTYDNSLDNILKNDDIVNDIFEDNAPFDAYWISPQIVHENPDDPKPEEYYMYGEDYQKYL